MDVATEPGRNIGRGELVEAELTAFIEKRDKQRRQTEGERRAEEAWKESERRYDEKRRRENRAAWYGWHLDQVERHRRTLEGLIASHEDEAAKLMETQSEGAA